LTVVTAERKKNVP